MFYVISQYLIQNDVHFGHCTELLETIKYKLKRSNYNYFISSN